jgi:hypothetical protein
MTLFPAARLAPFTVSAAVALVPETASAAVPREAPPAANEIVPDSPLLPLAAFTVAVRTVVALCAILAGLAATFSVVGTSGAATFTVTAAEVEALKLLLPP